MNVIEELKKLAAEAQTDHVKALLAGEVAKLEAEAKEAAESLHARIGEAFAHLAEDVRAEATAMWAKIRKVL